MTNSIEISERFRYDFSKCDKLTQTILQKWIDKQLLPLDDFRLKGQALKENYWRYRVGNYRLIGLIQENRLILLALVSDIYDKERLK